MYEFKPEYRIGVEKLDNEHEHIFELTEEAYQLLKNENMLYKYDELKKILDGIKEYTANHFMAEEAYMASLSYKDMDQHKLLHRMFIRNMEKYWMGVEDISLGTQDEMILELLEYLANWLQEHILKSDMKILKK